MAISYTYIQVKIHCHSSMGTLEKFLEERRSSWQALLLLLRLTNIQESVNLCMYPANT